MLVNRRKLRIEWGDCDPAGIVYFPRYFEYFDVSTSTLLEVAGYPKHIALKKFGVTGWPLVDMGAKFKASSTYGDEVEIESKVTQWGRSSFRIEHALIREGRVGVEAWEVRVWVARDSEDATKIRSVPIPEEVLDILKAGLPAR